MPAEFVFPEPDAERWFALIENPGVSMVLVEDDGELLGFSACGEPVDEDEDVDASVGEVRSFFVAPGSWRGGVGRVLMAAVLDTLRGRGYTQAIVWSFAENERANRFYENMGFARDGAEEPTPDWANIPGIRYRRSL